MASNDVGQELFRDLCRHDSDEEQILQNCIKTMEGALLYCSLHNSTVLHLACSFKKFELAKNLLISMDDNKFSILPDRTDAWGDTVLHSAATSNKGIEFVSILLQRVPDLLCQRNHRDESCVFNAIRYGKRKMFYFLAQQVDKFCELNTQYDHLHFFHNKDNTTILHMAILTRQFDVAFTIAERYTELCDLKDKSQMSALELLASTPTAFKSGVTLGPIKEFLYSVVPTDEHGTIGDVGIIGRAIIFILSSCCQGNSCFEFPLIKEISKLKKSNRDAVKLAIHLIKLDTSWRKTYSPPAEVTPNIIVDKFQHSSSDDDPNIIRAHLTNSEGEDIGQNIDISDASEHNEAPVLLAARNGCIEIVEETLQWFPQAVDYLNYDLENMLHVAIKSRNFKILDFIEKQPYLRKLVRAVDRKNNSILHMIKCQSRKGEISLDSKMKSPVLELSEELLLMERLEELCPPYLIYHRNEEKKTARELFAEDKEKLRDDAKDWLKRTSEHCTVVIILIATVAFAAAYTVPGGPDETGFPILLHRPLFIIFAITDVLSLGFALTAVVVFLTILTSPYRLIDFRRLFPQKLWLGFTLLFLSVSMMMVAFAATIILMIHSKERWIKIALYIIAFFPIVLFMLSYIPIYTNLLKTFNYWVKKSTKSLPRPTFGSRPPIPKTFSFQGV